MNREETFSQRLRRAREFRELGTNELNNLLGLTDGYVSRMESGARDNPGMKILIGLAQHLRVSLDWLVLGMGASPLTVEEEALGLRPLRERPSWLTVLGEAKRKRPIMPDWVFSRAGGWSSPGEELTVDLLLSIVDPMFLASGQRDQAAPFKAEMQRGAPQSGRETTQPPGTLPLAPPARKRA